MGLMTDVADSAPPGRPAAWRARRSSWIFAVALLLAMAAAALTIDQRSELRAFAEPTASAMGTVRSGGALLSGRRLGSGTFCWVSYEFTSAGGSAQRNWRFWEPGCGVSPGRPIHIQYVVARPEVNRPAGDSWSFSPLFAWFAAGVLLVVGILARASHDGG